MLKVDFSIDPPTRDYLSQILKSVQWDGSEKGIDLLLKHRPHPSLIPLWAILIKEGRVVGFATLYLPPPPSLHFAPVFIANFVIEDALHHAGMGSFLLEKIELWCKLHFSSSALSKPPAVQKLTCALYTIILISILFSFPFKIDSMQSY